MGHFNHFWTDLLRSGGPYGTGEALYILGNFKKACGLARTLIEAHKNLGLLLLFLFSGESNANTYQTVGDLLRGVDYEAFVPVIFLSGDFFYFDFKQMTRPD